jgi:hypothetical protein
MTPPRGDPVAGRRKSRTRWLIVGSVTLALLVACCAVSLTYGPYLTGHNIANPYWGVFNGSYSCTLEQGPPSPVLMVTRPETVIGRYLGDDIRLAGTYPCSSDTYHHGNDADPVFTGHPCPVVRPV